MQRCARQEKTPIGTLASQAGGRDSPSACATTAAVSTMFTLPASSRLPAIPGPRQPHTIVISCGSRVPCSNSRYMVVRPDLSFCEGLKSGELW